MRQIGSLKDARQAQVFSDYLVTRGISAHCEEDGGEWLVWVRDENKVAAAKGELVDFRRNFDDTRYRDASRAAQQLREEEFKRRRQAAKRVVNVRSQWSAPLSKRAPFVFSLILVCVLLTVVPMFSDAAGQIADALRFCSFEVFTRTGDGMTQIKSGQVWRVVTPVLLHGDPIHLLFNMYWLYVLSPQVESRKGSFKLAAIVIAVAALSNLAQFYLGPPIRVDGRVIFDPRFLGMSGVVYGILGYIWIKQRYDPSSGFMLNPSTFQILLFFLLLFWAMDIVGIELLRVANLAHVGGLLSGMGIAYVPIAMRRRD